MAASTQLQYAELNHFAVRSVKRSEKIGDGYFGSVEKLLMSGARPGLGKTYYRASLYRAGGTSEAVMRRFKSECQLLSRVRHPNIVNFIGVCFFQDYAPTLITELMPWSLEEFLNQPQDTQLHMKLSILSQVTRGLEELHSYTPPLVHMDLTSHNVMLNVDATIAKISDVRNFSIVDPERVTEYVLTNSATSSYRPPELFTLPFKVEMSVDIFSLGNLALYTIIQQFPGNLPPKSSQRVTYSELERRREYLDTLKHMTGPSSPIVTIIEKCLDDTPHLRPEAREVLEHINSQSSLDHSLYFEVHCDDGVKKLLEGEPDSIEMYTVGWLKIAGWKSYQFQIKDSKLTCTKATKKEVVVEVALTSIKKIEPEDATVHRDKSKHYFRIAFHGKQSPWLLRTSSEQQRFNWITAINEGSSSDYISPPNEASYNPDDMPAVYEQHARFVKSRSNRSLHERKSSRATSVLNKRFSSPLLSAIVNEEKDTTDNPTYYSHLHSRMERRASDELPSLPTLDETQHEAVYDEVQDVTPTQDTSGLYANQGSDSEHKYDDTVLSVLTPETDAPPIPPKKLKSRMQSFSLIAPTQRTDYARESSCEDEEGYVAVNGPPTGAAEPALDAAALPTLDLQLGQQHLTPTRSASSEVLPAPMATPTIDITHSQNSSDSEGGFGMFNDDVMDPVEHARLQGGTQDYISLGTDLSSMEVTTPQDPHPRPQIIPGMEMYFKYLQQSRLSPVQLEDGYTYEQDFTEAEDETERHHGDQRHPPKKTSTPIPSSSPIRYRGDDTDATQGGARKMDSHAYDKLDHWRQHSNSSESKISLHSSPTRYVVDPEKPQQFLPRTFSTSPRGKFFAPDASFQPIEMIPTTADFSQQPRDPVQLHTFASILQNLQHAMQALYANMPIMLQDFESPAARQQQLEQYEQLSKEYLSAKGDSEKGQPVSEIPAVSVAGPVDEGPEPQVLMQQCLKELLRKTPVAFSDKLLVTGDGKETMPPELKKLARANSQIGDTDGSAPLNKLKSQANYVKREQLFDMVPIEQGQYSSRSTASLQQHLGSVIKVLVTTVHMASDTEERKKFFQQQAAIAEMIHPNIACHFVIRDEDLPMMVSEILPNGDLKIFLQNNHRPDAKLLSYMLDVSMGMHYLAQTGLVHRNIAAKSIVVDQNEKCKISNFTHLVNTRDSTGRDIPERDLLSFVRWMAPEGITRKQFSTASDVWSFGVLQWEMKHPHDEPYQGLTDEEVLEQQISSVACLKIPKSYPPEIKNIMKACWQQDASQRPSFLLIAKLITNLTVN